MNQSKPRNHCAKRKDSFQRRLVLYGLSAATILTQQVGKPESATTDAGKLSPVEAFKKFMVSPPMIESIVWRRTMPLEMTVGLAPDEGQPGPKGTVSFFNARWQPNCLFLKSGKDSDVVKPGRTYGEEIQTAFDDDLWIVGANGLTTHWHDHISKSKLSMPAPSRQFLNRSDVFREVMNMGVMHLDIGAASWTKDQLRATGYLQEINAPVNIRGVLAADANGYAKELDLQYRIQTNGYHYTLRYGYDPRRECPFLPSTIQSFLIDDGKQTKLSEISILSVQFGSSPMPPTTFAPQAGVAKGFPVLYFTNGVWFATNALGKLAPVPPSFDGRAVDNASMRFDRNRIYFLAVMISSVAAFSIVWRINKNNKTKWSNT